MKTHVDSILEGKDIKTVIEAAKDGKCPDCGAKMKDGKCPKCDK